MLIYYSSLDLSYIMFLFYFSFSLTRLFAEGGPTANSSSSIGSSLYQQAVKYKFFWDVGVFWRCWCPWLEPQRHPCWPKWVRLPGSTVTDMSNFQRPHWEAPPLGSVVHNSWPVGSLLDFHVGVGYEDGPSSCLEKPLTLDFIPSFLVLYVTFHSKFPLGIYLKRF